MRQRLFLRRLRIDIEISDIFDKHYFDTLNTDIDVNCSQMTINQHKNKNKKIENRRRQIVVDSHSVVFDLIVYWFNVCQRWHWRDVEQIVWS